ncbi:UNVERIFIED_CONTAM: hypothetical protein GTU68_065228 [Idotea baltica]|nr:hypothetical protein [Idotea baltica]
MGMFASPLCSLENRGKKVIGEIIELIKQNQVAKVVIGMPFELDGSIGPQAEIVDRFAVKLAKRLPDGIELHAHDERLSTVEAGRALRGTKLKNSEKHAALDRMSAAIILEGFMAKERGSL